MDSWRSRAVDVLACDRPTHCTHILCSPPTPTRCSHCCPHPHPTPTHIACSLFCGEDAPYHWRRELSITALCLLSSLAVALTWPTASERIFAITGASGGWVLQPPNLSQTIPPRPAATRLLAGVCLVCCVIPVAIHLRLFCAGWKARRAGYPTPAPAGALHPPPSHKQLPRGWHLGRSAPWSLGGEGATAWLLEEDNHDAAAAIPLLGEEAGEDQGAGAGTGTGTGPGAGGGDSPYLGGPERGAGERQGEGAEGGEGLERGGSDAVPLSGVAKMYDRGQDLSLSTWLPSHMGGAGAGAGGGWLAARAGGRGGAGGGGAGSGGCTG